MKKALIFNQSLLKSNSIEKIFKFKHSLINYKIEVNTTTHSTKR